MITTIASLKEHIEKLKDFYDLKTGNCTGKVSIKLDHDSWKK